MNKYLEKIKSKEAIIGIIGLGYVGLPLSRAFSSNDFKVIGFDINDMQLNSLNKNQSYIKHISDETIRSMREDKGFICTSDFSMLKEVDVIIICVPTPLSKHREPDLGPIMATAESISKYVQKGQLIILESSTYPGTTDEELGNAIEKSGLVKNVDFYLAYSPEREDPGNKDFSTETIPKIVGADNEIARELAVATYESVISKVVALSSTRAAEATKLTENIFRSVNIALVNELKIIFDAMGIDVWEVIDGAATKPFGFMPFYPGPGLGGHCIPIDPFYLTYKAKEYGVRTRFIELAGELNTEMPRLVIRKLSSALSTHGKKSLNGSKILLIGLSYKKDIDDMRESPSLVLLKLLEDGGANVDYHDSYLPEIPESREYIKFVGKKSVELNPTSLKNYDAVLISTNHSDIDYNLIAENALLVIDTRNAMKNISGNAIIVKA